MSERKSIKSALISVFNKEGLAPILNHLSAQNVQLYSTGGTQKYIEELGLACTQVDEITQFPEILGGRVKTLHPKIFGGILARRGNEEDLQQLQSHSIPTIDLVIVDLYPFQETLKATTEEQQIIEKIDIGGPSMIRAAAKNFADVLVVASRNEYAELEALLTPADGSSNLERRAFAAKAFEVVMNYDIAINNYFNEAVLHPLTNKMALRYGENPHQEAGFYGEMQDLISKENGKALSYNNLVDVDAALSLMAEFETTTPTFAIIKHTNVCGLAQRATLLDTYKAALAGDPESAFGGVLITNTTIDIATAEALHELFFEVLIAPSYDDDALALLKAKKNRILLVQHKPLLQKNIYKSMLNGILVQQADKGLEEKWEIAGNGTLSNIETADLKLANILVKHLKSNAIVLVKDQQLLGKGCGQTSRIDALRQALGKARQFGMDLQGAVMASDAFFPFDDCVKLANDAGIRAVVQPGGSIRDKDSVAFCEASGMTMVMTGMRHFLH